MTWPLIPGVDPGTDDVQGSEFPGVRNHEGHRDFGQEVTDAFEAVLPKHDRELPDSIAEGLPEDVPVVEVMQERPANAHYRTFVLGANAAAQEVSLPYARRASLVITNVGANPCSIGADNEVTQGAPNTALIQAGASRTLTHTDKVFAHSTLGTTVDVIEEHYS